MYEIVNNIVNDIILVVHNKLYICKRHKSHCVITSCTIMNIAVLQHATATIYKTIIRLFSGTPWIDNRSITAKSYVQLRPLPHYTVRYMQHVKKGCPQGICCFEFSKTKVSIWQVIRTSWLGSFRHFGQAMPHDILFYLKKSYYIFLL